MKKKHPGKRGGGGGVYNILKDKIGGRGGAYCHSWGTDEEKKGNTN